MDVQIQESACPGWNPSPIHWLAWASLFFASVCSWSGDNSTYYTGFLCGLRVHVCKEFSDMLAIIYKFIHTYKWMLYVHSANIFIGICESDTLKHLNECQYQVLKKCLCLERALCDLQSNLSESSISRLFGLTMNVI